MNLVPIAGRFRRDRRAVPMRSLPTRLATAVALGFAILAAPGPTLASSLPLDAACAVPDGFVALPGRLDRVAGRIAARQPVAVLAIGSSSTAGVGATAPDRTYPARLAFELSRRLPAARFDVANRGIGGEVVSTTAARLRALVTEKAPDLVVWQVGTNDAVRGVGVDTMAEIVEDGIDFLAERDIDVILMDPQFYPRIAADTGYAAVVARIAAIARDDGIPLFRRFEAMRYWAGLPDARPMLWKDAFHMNDLGYACVGSVLAEGIARRLDAAGTPAVATDGTATPAPVKEPTAAPAAADESVPQASAPAAAVTVAVVAKATSPTAATPAVLPAGAPAAEAAVLR